jgi:hypothetical protein
VGSLILRLTILAAVLVPATASAQIVNIQPLLGPVDRPGFSLEFKGGMSLYTGNVALFSGDAALLMRYQLGRHRIISATRGALAFKNNAQTMNQLFSHLRYQVFFFDWFAWELWGQGAEDQFTRLQLRILGGTGPRFDAVRLPTFRLGIGLHYMLEYERLRAEGAGPGEPLEELNHRASTYLTFTWDIVENLSLQETVYVQPKLTDPLGDFRVSNEVQLTAKVSRYFALGTSFQVKYDSAAPATIEALDTITLATLTAGF